VEVKGLSGGSPVIDGYALIVAASFQKKEKYCQIVLTRRGGYNVPINTEIPKKMPRMRG